MQGPLSWHHDPRSETFTIEGTKYAPEFFEALGGGGPKIGALFRILRDDRGRLIIKRSLLEQRMRDLKRRTRHE